MHATNPASDCPWCPITRLLLCSAPLFATDSNEALIERLEAAEAAGQQHDVMDEIRERTARGPLSVKFTERLVAELVSDETYSYRNVMAVLPQLAGERGCSEQSLVYLALGLAAALSIHSFTTSSNTAIGREPCPTTVS